MTFVLADLRDRPEIQLIAEGPRIDKVQRAVHLCIQAQLARQRQCWPVAARLAALAAETDQNVPDILLLAIEHNYYAGIFSVVLRLATRILTLPLPSSKVFFVKRWQAKALYKAGFEQLALQKIGALLVCAPTQLLKHLQNDLKQLLTP